MDLILIKTILPSLFLWFLGFLMGLDHKLGQFERPLQGASFVTLFSSWVPMVLEIFHFESIKWSWFLGFLMGLEHKTWNIWNFSAHLLSLCSPRESLWFLRYSFWIHQVELISWLPDGSKPQNLDHLKLPHTSFVTLFSSWVLMVLEIFHFESINWSWCSWK